jgi:hypothetical protein
MSPILQVGLLNVGGYYNSLLSFIDKAVDEGFIRPTARHIIVLAPTPKELIDKLEVSCVNLTISSAHCQYGPAEIKNMIGHSGASKDNLNTSKRRLL